MSADLSLRPGAGPVPVLLVVQPAPAQSSISPRSFAGFKNDLEQFGSLIGKFNSFLEQQKDFCLPMGKELRESVDALQIEADAQARLRKYEQEREELLVQCQQLKAIQSKMQHEIQDIGQQLGNAMQAQHESDNKRSELIKALEAKKLELESANKCMEAWLLAFNEAQNEVGEKKIELDAAKLQLKNAEDKFKDKDAVVIGLHRLIQDKNTVIEQHAARIKDRDGENRAIQAQNEALQGEVALYKQEKVDLELVARQQKEALQKKEQHIEVQGQHLQGLEGRLQDQKGELAQVQKLVQGLQEQKVQIVEPEKTAKKVSRVAIGVLIAVGIALAVALAFWLNPQLASAAGDLLRRAWSAMTGVSPALGLG